MADDAGGEEEWEVEEISDDRKLGDGSLELLVKWKGGEETWEETWEPYENVAETEAFDRYERLHGPVTVDTVRDLPRPRNNFFRCWPGIRSRSRRRQDPHLRNTDMCILRRSRLRAS